MSSLLTAEISAVYTDVYMEVPDMTTKVFTSGNSQAVRIPKELQVNCSEMEIRKVGSAIILTPIKEQIKSTVDDRWEPFFHALSGFSDDFMADGRNQPMLNVQDKTDVPS